MKGPYIEFILNTVKESLSLTHTLFFGLKQVQTVYDISRVITTASKNRSDWQSSAFRKIVTCNLLEGSVAAAVVLQMNSTNKKYIA